MNRQIDTAEVKKHRNEKSAWIIIHNEVFDVTKFLKEHPGGAESLLEFAGKDGTQGFEDVGHSKDARVLMKQYKIGFLPANERSTFLDTWPIDVPDKKPFRIPRSPKRCESDVKKKVSPYPLSREASKTSQAPKLEKRVDKIVVPIEKSRSSCNEKTWRTYDGSPSRRSLASKSSSKDVDTKKTERHVDAIVVPRDRRRAHLEPEPEPESSNLKWYLLALAAAIIIGVSIKKYTSA